MSDGTLASSAPPAAIEISEVAPPATQRLLSLDAFRGITVAAMLLVNNPGSWSAIYPPLRHAEWHGWTPTDLIFPFFLFIVGVAMSFSFGKLLSRGARRGSVLAKSAKRAAILVGLGLALAAFPWWEMDLSTLRIPGVLQRIGVAFLAAAPAVLWLEWRGRALLAAALLLGYWAAMRWVPVPGVGAGVWEPGRDLGAYIDRLVFTTDHLWKQARTWDPEGLFSTIPAVGTVLLGTLAGEWLRARRPAGQTVRGLVGAGVAGVALGQFWGLAFPINKPLWTSSYVVLTAGMALLGLALCYWLVDVRGHRRWAFPFVLFGVNAIAAFWLSGLMARALTLVHVGDETLKGWLFDRAFAAWLSPVNASLAFALCFVLFWTAVMWAFYRRGIVVKV